MKICMYIFIYIHVYIAPIFVLTFRLLHFDYAHVGGKSPFVKKRVTRISRGQENPVKIEKVKQKRNEKPRIGELPIEQFETNLPSFLRPLGVLLRSN